MYITARMSLKYLRIFTPASAGNSGSCFSPFRISDGTSAVGTSVISSGDCRFFGDIGGWSLGESKLPSSLQETLVITYYEKSKRLPFPISDVKCSGNISGSLEK